MLRTSLGEVRGDFCFGICLLLPPLASWRGGEGEDLKKGGVGALQSRAVLLRWVKGVGSFSLTSGKVCTCPFPCDLASAK